MAQIKVHLLRALGSRKAAGDAHLAAARAAAARAQTQASLDAGVAAAAKLGTAPAIPAGQKGSKR